MVDNRIPPLVPARKRRPPVEEEAPAAGSGSWILRAGHRRLYVDLGEPPLASDEDEQLS
ncbi:hypothetical protein [Streptacidiphilus jiangxiensis]|nr:hypothetical protein [Streptacidiphilus jiangxiensis]